MANEFANGESPTTVELDPKAVSQFYQPPTGGVEMFLAPLLGTQARAVESAFAGLRNYAIDATLDQAATDGRASATPPSVGPEAVEHTIRNAVLKHKLLTDAAFPRGAWDGWLLLTLEVDLCSVLHGEHASAQQPNRVTDIHPSLAESLSEESHRRVHLYADQLRAHRELDPPLYITGDALCEVGANPLAVSRSSMWMLDGAKRMIAHALAHRETMTIQLICTESQYEELLAPSAKQSLADQVHSLQWFHDYQSIPQVGLQGLRTLQRYEAIDTERLRGKRVMDFGCNLGQASLKAAQAGAQEVIGLEGMPDTIAAARSIHGLCPLPNLSYHQINFNAPDFEDRIDQVAPGQVDYSFFFSVYRTRELTQRERLLRYILDKSKLGVFFEGHGDPAIDTLDYYHGLFAEMQVSGQFIGWSEGQSRPLFYLDRSGSELPYVLTPTPRRIQRKAIPFAWGHLA